VCSFQKMFDWVLKMWNQEAILAELLLGKRRWAA